MINSHGIRKAGAVPTRRGGVSEWQRWVPYAATVWSLVYALLAGYWAVGGNGFPYTSESVTDPLGPLLGRLGPALAWIVVMLAGLPAAVMGAAMLRGVRGRILRPFLITVGLLLGSALLLLMTSLNLLVMVGYLPAAILGHLTAEQSQSYWEGWMQWATFHQGLCLVGGFLWLGATLCYARRSADACLYCGRQDGPEGWTSPERAAHWGRLAVFAALGVPLFYAFTRYAWALGFPLGMSEERFRYGQEHGMWISGALFLANFILVGGVLMLGLVQRWGEVFPRWMIGLSGRRIPIALAVAPALLAAVLLAVGGIGIWSDVGGMVANMVAGQAKDKEIIAAILFELGPTLLFSVWGAALALAALGYYYRRRGPCRMCGRGAQSQPAQELAKSIV
jgi:hypothetical protein